ncbi:hypothetical protein F1728_00755 [Gimesia benthica]|uniref:Uncharacterized protein n=1 Tax=Gimesia benthica TaxID=2608982 RepID=A0A6I6A7H0_9PLAN|nr:hypothetical protein [Gimesia benthica]QGQ21315.1 hypothetical protein F1728_00755 [Gimesia benthica]
MSNAEAASQEEMIQAVYHFAAEKMRDGASNQEIQKALMEQGVDEESAGIIVTQLNELRDQQAKEAGQKNMMFGALWCIGGIVVTALTYSAASEGAPTWWPGARLFLVLSSSSGGCFRPGCEWLVCVTD